MLDHAAGSGQHSHEVRGADCYETHPAATEALLRVESKWMPMGVLEPACGPGSICRVLQANGYKVFASDLHDYGYARPGVDFLKSDPRIEWPAIVTNPPYQLAEQFVRHALKCSSYVAMLLRLAFLESERRSDILDSSCLARIHVFRNRLPMMHRKDWNGPKASSAIPFAWFVWERGHQGPATIDRISWEPTQTNV